MLEPEVRYDVAAELAEMRRLLEAILDAVAAPDGLLADFREASWSAGGFDDLDLGGRFAGIWIVNKSAATIWVGFGPGTGSSLRGVVPVLANAERAIPYPCSFVSVGGASAGSAVVAPLLGPVEPGGA
jgi:hypothetical protein